MPSQPQGSHRIFVFKKKREDRDADARERKHDLQLLSQQRQSLSKRHDNSDRLRLIGHRWLRTTLRITLLSRVETQRFATASYIGVSISGWPTNYFEWSARNRISNVLVRPSPGNERRRIFDLETVQLEVKHSGRIRAAPTPTGTASAPSLPRYLESTLCPSNRAVSRYSPRSPGYTFQWSTTRLDRILRWNPVRGFRRLAESFPPISHRHPAFRERKRERERGRQIRSKGARGSWVFPDVFSLLAMCISRQGYWYTKRSFKRSFVYFRAVFV